MFPQYTPRELGCFNKINSKITLFRCIERKRTRKLFLTDDEVSPLDETALARQFRFSALRRLRTTQLSPTMTGPTKTEDRRGMKLQQLTFIHRRDREFSRSPEGARTPREQVNFYEQVEQVLTDALRCSDVENMDLEQVSPPLDAVRLAAGQTLYGLTPTALRRWSYSNLALRRMANLSTRWSNIGQDCRESEEVLGLQFRWVSN